ncbi:hypothetical protein GOODEAATRI_000462 [Goodea atripinnis]|uniref:Uncharacterized protein n=1 Tax=Goodea atripinnis TaxID=208336 RepID=A0ABV0PA75_9TELE
MSSPDNEVAFRTPGDESVSGYKYRRCRQEPFPFYSHSGISSLFLTLALGETTRVMFISNTKNTRLSLSSHPSWREEGEAADAPIRGDLQRAQRRAEPEDVGISAECNFSAILTAAQDKVALSSRVIGGNCFSG